MDTRGKVGVAALVMALLATGLWRAWVTAPEEQEVARRSPAALEPAPDKTPENRPSPRPEQPEKEHAKTDVVVPS